jgi:predicted TIM-barrel fold metal-dependent hydrolase
VISAGAHAAPDDQRTIRRAREADDGPARALADHPAHYAGFAQPPLHDATAATEELSRCVKDLGLPPLRLDGRTPTQARRVPLSVLAPPGMMTTAESCGRRSAIAVATTGSPRTAPNSPTLPWEVSRIAPRS